MPKRVRAALHIRIGTLEHQVAEVTVERDRIWEFSLDLFGVADERGIWLDVNPAWERLLGWKPDEVVGRTSEWIEHPDDRTKTRAEVGSLAMGETTFEFQNRFRSRKGDYRTLSWRATFSDGKIYAIARDVTQEQTRMQALHDAQDFARLALTSVGGVGAWTFDLMTDRFAYDAAIAALYGIDPERGTIGVPSAEFVANVHPDDRLRLRQTMADGLRNPGELELEYRIVHPGGAVRWVLSRGITYFDEAGRPVRRTGVGIETTRQREIEETLRQSQKMEAVGQLTGGLAHDFNNLLAGISGSLEMMQARMQQGRLSDVERYIEAAQGAARRASALTHRLLAFSRRQTLEPKPVDVNRLVEGMHDLIQRTVGPGLPVGIVQATEAWPALVDPSQLENALLNLCINSRDAMPNGGTITIETSNEWVDDGTARRHDFPEGPYLCLCVTDTGTGMPPEVIERVFEPFFTTKPLGQGTGLGLSMIYGFAQQSGGQVRIRSGVGQGTTVCIYLPRYVGDVIEEERATSDAGLPRSERKETVLIVDDEPTVRMLLKEILEELGYATIEAEDGVSGLQVLRSHASIDLLVTDVGLPGGMNGRQMTDAARVSRPDLKVLFVTGYAENAVLGNGHLPSGMAVLTKPFAIETIAARIRSLIENGQEPTNHRELDRQGAFDA